jgi:hypothetical protein
MNEKPKGIAGDLAELARQERRRQGAHPTLERLAAYHAGELDVAQTEATQDHLAVCPECVRTLRELARFQDEPAEEDEAAAEASWRALRARLDPERLGHRGNPETRLPQAPVTSRSRRFSTSPRTVVALAAGLVACLVGFPLWMTTHRSTPPSLAVSVPGGGEIVRGEGDSALIVLRQGDATAVLVLPVPRKPAFPIYRVEIRTLGGELLLRADANPAPVASSPASPGAGDAPPPRLLTIAIAGRQLAPGDYRLRIFGLRDGHPEALIEHPLRVLPA